MALWINDGLHEAAADIHSFLLVGQSNMAGRGDLTKENAITAPDCFMLRGFVLAVVKNVRNCYNNINRLIFTKNDIKFNTIR